MKEITFVEQLWNDLGSFSGNKFTLRTNSPSEFHLSSNTASFNLSQFVGDV